MSDVVSLLEQLIAIDSVNPSLDPGGAGETEIALYVCDWFAARGLETHWLEPEPGRPSVVAVARGRGGGPRLMLNAHLDTVGASGMTDPFRPRLAGGRLHGRGASDMKASLAACMIALEHAAKLDLAGDVILTAVADEEHASIGTRAVLEHWTADAAILTEPTGMQPCVAHRGFALFELELRGVASHTSQPDRGANALTALGRVLVEIEALDRRLRAADAHPLLGHASAQAVLASGGSELFTTPASATLTFERRTLPGETAAAIEREWHAILERVCATDRRLKWLSKLALQREPFESPADTEIVHSLEHAVSRVTGKAPSRVGAPYWMDSALVQAAGIPTVVFGPTAHGIHGPDESVVLEEVHALVRVLSEVIRDYCR